MVRISEKAREALKKPLGRVFKTLRTARLLSRTHRIISVGDVCTLALTDAGINPHLAVFDFRYMRRKLKTRDLSRLKTFYPNPVMYSNPAGTVSSRLMADAEKLLRKGGGVLIKGEEDLTALAFIRAAGAGDIIIYGQPGEGIVVVKPDRKIKKKVDGFLFPD